MQVELTEPSRPFPIHRWEAKITHISSEDMRTIYFALREYRDNLHKTLFTVTHDNAPNQGEVLDHDDQHLFDMCDQYEELMFLHEALTKVNTALFEITQNHDIVNRRHMQDWLDV